MTDYSPLHVRHGTAAQAAVDTWSEVLSSADGPAQAEQLVALQRERNVLFEGEPISHVALPRFIDEAEHERWGRLTDLVSSAARKVIAALRDDLDRYTSELGEFEPLERELIFAPYGFDWPDVSARWDAFATGDYLSFVELNGAVPGGIHYEDALATCFADLPVFGIVAERCTITRTTMTEPLWAGMRAAWKQWGGTGTPVVGITDWLGGHEHTEPEFWLFREWLESRGITAIVADPREWELVDGRLTAQGVTVDLLDRRLTSPDLLARPDDCSVLIEAFRNNAVCVVDPFEMGLLHRKGFFSLLTDADHGIPFSTAERDAIAVTIPWTRRLTERETDLPDGTRGDLVAYVGANAEALVLKPGDDGAGRGIHLGWTTEPGEWATAVDEALAADYVVQARVIEVTDRFPLVEPFGEWDDFFLDSDPMVAGGRFGGTMSRLSHAELTNVSQGGSIVPTFTVGP